jgi:hypothetical protein
MHKIVMLTREVCLKVGSAARVHCVCLTVGSAARVHGVFEGGQCGQGA